MAIALGVSPVCTLVSHSAKVRPPATCSNALLIVRTFFSVNYNGHNFVESYEQKKNYNRFHIEMFTLKQQRGVLCLLKLLCKCITLQWTMCRAVEVPLSGLSVFLTPISAPLFAFSFVPVRLSRRYLSVLSLVGAVFDGEACKIAPLVSPYVRTNTTIK